MPFALFNVINTFYSNQYFLSANTTNVDEITSRGIQFTATTSSVYDGTVLYYDIQAVSGTINASDFVEESILTGTFAINNSVGTRSITIRQDFTTEGTESFRMNLRTGSSSGPIVATSQVITIADTSQNPTFTVTANTASVNEGASVLFTISTTNISPGTVLYWTDDGSSEAEDFSDGLLSGSVTLSGSLSSASATVTRTLLNDLFTDGTENIVLNVRTDSTSGPVVATTTVTINDTSLTPRGSASFTTAGTFNWTVPAGVRQVSVVAIGGGGGGKTKSGTVVTGGSGGAGAGGCLSYRNNIPVTPGSVLTVRVGAGGSPSEGGTGAAPSGNASFLGPDANLTNAFVFARGGGGGFGSNDNYNGGTPGLSTGLPSGSVGFRGGAGGRGGTTFAPGGGGAAGYSGNGGVGGQNSTNPSAAGSGGGSGGGGHSTGSTVTGLPRTGGKGGGTGILGTGTNGGAGSATGGAFAGNGGNGSQFTDSGAFGQGGASAYDNDESLIADPTRAERLTGGNGAVRIVWPGDTRSYPSPGND